jgi:predicted naringenin-chalcone synthase
MGCSNGVVAIGLIKDLLQARPNSVALFVPAEITTYCSYLGHHKTYHVATAIFRMGGAAMVLTNKPAMRRKSKCVWFSSLGGGAAGCRGVDHVLQCYQAARRLGG